MDMSLRPQLFSNLTVLLEFIVLSPQLIDAYSGMKNLLTMPDNPNKKPARSIQIWIRLSTIQFSRFSSPVDVVANVRISYSSSL